MSFSAANLSGIAAIGASVVAFVLTWNFAKGRSVGTKAGLLLLSGVLSVPAFLFVIYYWHVLPEWAWFYTVRSWSGSEFLAVFVGCLGGSVAAFLPRLLLGFPLFGVIAITILPYLKPILSPLPDGELRDQWKDGVCLQSTLSTCGPATVCTILGTHGDKASEREIARAAYSYTGGTEAWYLARYARSRGYAPRFDFRKTFSPDVVLPAVVGVHRGAMGHFIAVLKIDRNEVIFADPMQGLERLSLPKFRQRYDFTGFHLSLPKR